MVPWSSSRSKVQIRLSIQRIKILREKREALAKAARREIATLVERGKLEIARIKVENIMNDDLYVQLLEVLELYSETLEARFGLLDSSGKDPDPAVYDAVCAVIHAAPRTEIRELHLLRDMLMHKFGREFALAVMENRDGCVPTRVTSKLVIAAPPSELVDSALQVIAEGYGIGWKPPCSDDADEGGLKESLPRGELESPLPSDPDTADTANAAKPTTKVPDERFPDIGPSSGLTPTQSKQGASEDAYEALRKRLDALRSQK